MSGFAPEDRRVVHYRPLVLVLSGWALVLVGVALALTMLPERLPWMSTTPLTGFLVGIPLALLVYLPVPSLVKAGLFEGRRGLIELGVWLLLWSLGFCAVLLLGLPSAFLVLLMAWLLVPLLVVAHQVKATGRL